MKHRGFVEKYAGGLDDRVAVTTDASGSYARTLKPYEREVVVTSSLGVGTIKLPPVALCEGMEFGITALTGSSNAVTVTEYASGDSHDWPADAALNADLDRGRWKSDGKKWWVIADQYT